MCWMNPIRRLVPSVSLAPLALLCFVLVACGASPSPTPEAAPPGPTGSVPESPRTVQPTPRTTLSPPAVPTQTGVAFLPAIKKADVKRVLFINGDFVPDSGYPHSRVLDDGKKPESFTRLRKEVLEGQLSLAVDEFILTPSSAITPGLLSPYVLVVLGSNDRVLAAGEVQTLTRYYASGGNILTYADFQYGPDNWASDNSFLKQFGVEVFPDNLQPATTITDIVTTHPVMQGVHAFATEGSSQFLISASTLTANQVIAKCSPLERVGCAVKPEQLSQIKSGDVVACVWVRVNNNGGRLAGTCDRNTFHNGPGPGTDIDQFDNRIFATNLFRWLTQ